MDIKQIIDSGILENYVLGLASIEERQEVEGFARQFPEIQAEINALEKALELFAKSKAVPMPEGLKTSIIREINKTGVNSITNSSSNSNSSSSSSSSSNSNSNLKSWLWGIAIIAATSIFYNLLQNKENQQNKTQLDQINNRFLDLQLICDSTSAINRQQAEQIKILRDINYRHVLLKGTPKAPNALAAVYDNRKEKKTYLDVHNLPTPPTDKQYQLWAQVNNEMVDMGVFNLPIDSNFIEVPFMENSVGYGVTLEPLGGKPTPNLDELYMFGEASE